MVFLFQTACISRTIDTNGPPLRHLNFDFIHYNDVLIFLILFPDFIKFTVFDFGIERLYNGAFVIRAHTVKYLMPNPETSFG